MVLKKGLLGAGIALATCAGLAVAIGLAGCKSRPQQAPPEQPPQPVAADQATRDDLEGLRQQIGRLEAELAKAKAEKNAPPAAPAAEPPASPPQPSDEERGAAALQQAEGDRGLQLELAQKYYETALVYFRNFQYKEARANCEKALAINPDHKEARELNAQIGLALGQQPEAIETYKTESERRLAVMIEQTQVEIRNHLARGKELFGQGKFKEAISEFEAIEEKLRWKPYDIGMNAERDEAHALLLQARQNRVQQQAEIDRKQREDAQRVAVDEETARRREVRDRIKHLFREGIAALERKDYAKCVQLADEILEQDATFENARVLKADAIRARDMKYNKDYVEQKVEKWKQTFEDMEESNIPYHEGKLLRFTNSKRWKEISGRAPTGAFAEKIAEDPELAAIKSKLDTLRIDLDFTDANLYDIIEFIREFAKINIEIHPDVKKEGIADKKITFQMKELVLKSVLSLLLRQYGLAYAFEDKVLVITKPELAEGQPVLEVHDVRDLLQTIRDFAGPDLELAQGGGGAGGVGATFGGEPTEKPAITSEQLQNLIKGNIATATWEERRDEVSLAMTGNGQLLVIHTPKVQQEIRDFLKNLRSFTGAMVSIESRFIAISDDFLQDVGVEFHGSGEHAFNQVGYPGGNVGDGIAGPTFNGVNNAQFAGVDVHERGNSPYDLRFRSAYSPPANPPPGSEPTIGKTLSATMSSVTGTTNPGGLALQYTILNDPNIEVLLRAVEKTQKATQLRAPRVTAFNTQRAHILLERQQTYVKDYDVEIATNSIAYDPVIGVIQDGLVFDVRPIISNDRRYITLELRPSIARLENMVLYPIASLNGATVNIQLPTVQLQKAQTTVRMPDKGTVLIAGLKNLLDRDYSRETPFLAQIPILGFLFRQKTKVDEKANIIVLINAEIIDTAEREREMR